MKAQVATTVSAESGMLLKTIASVTDADRLGSHAGSHTDGHARNTPDPGGQPGETSPRHELFEQSRTPTRASTDQVIRVP
jgi:hypothetical protein